MLFTEELQEAEEILITEVQMQSYGGHNRKTSKMYYIIRQI